MNCFIKDFRKYLLQSESLTNNSDKHLRKTIKQSNKNSYKNFNRLKSRFNRLFIAAKYQTVREFEGKRDLHTEIILVHSIPKLHPVLNQTTEFHKQSITDYKPTPQRSDFESHKAYSPSLHTQHLKTEHHLSLLNTNSM